jgi:hypothetical protein
MKFRACFIWLLVCWGLPLLAQPTATLRFSQDSAALGEIVELTLEVTHAPGTQVFFPSRRRDFVPFEFVKSNKPTQRQSGEHVIEAVVYEVRTFDLAPRQAVRLPFSFESQADTAYREVDSDTIFLAERVPVLNDTLKYRLSTEVYELVEVESNLQTILLVLGGLILLALVYWLMRRPTQLLLRRRTLRRDWQQLRRQALRLEKEADQQELFDQLSTLWKHWMDPDDTYGLPSMTTTELETRLPQLSHLSPGQRAILLQASRDADRSIYAEQHLDQASISQLIHSLVDVMQIEYKRKDHMMRRRQSVKS